MFVYNKMQDNLTDEESSDDDIAQVAESCEQKLAKSQTQNAGFLENIRELQLKNQELEKMNQNPNIVNMIKQATEIRNLKSENKTLQTQNDNLQGENKNLQGEKITLQTQNDNLQSENKKLQGEKTELQTQNNTLQGENKTLQTKNVNDLKTITDLEKLVKNYNNTVNIIIKIIKSPNGNNKLKIIYNIIGVLYNKLNNIKIKYEEIKQNFPTNIKTGQSVSDKPVVSPNVLQPVDAAYDGVNSHSILNYDPKFKPENTYSELLYDFLSEIIGIYDDASNEISKLLNECNDSQDVNRYQYAVGNIYKVISSVKKKFDDKKNKNNKILLEAQKFLTNNKKIDGTVLNDPANTNDNNNNLLLEDFSYQKNYLDEDKNVELAILDNALSEFKPIDISKFENGYEKQLEEEKRKSQQLQKELNEQKKLNGINNDEALTLLKKELNDARLKFDELIQQKNAIELKQRNNAQNYIKLIELLKNIYDMLSKIQEFIQNPEIENPLHKIINEINHHINVSPNNLSLNVDQNEELINTPLLEIYNSILNKIKNIENFNRDEISSKELNELKEQIKTLTEVAQKSKTEIGDKNVDSTSNEKGDKNVDSTSNEKGDKNAETTSTETGDKNAEPTSTETGGKNTGTTSTETGDKNAEPTSTETGGKNAEPTSTETGGKNTGTTSTETGDKNTETTSTETGDKNTETTSTETGGKNMETTSTETGDKNMETILNLCSHILSESVEELKKLSFVELVNKLQMKFTLLKKTVKELEESKISNEEQISNLNKQEQEKEKQEKEKQEKVDANDDAQKKLVEMKILLLSVIREKIQKIIIENEEIIKIFGKDDNLLKKNFEYELLLKNAADPNANLIDLLNKIKEEDLSALQNKLKSQLDGIKNTLIESMKLCIMQLKKSINIDSDEIDKLQKNINTDSDEIDKLKKNINTDFVNNRISFLTKNLIAKQVILRSFEENLKEEGWVKLLDVLKKIQPIYDVDIKNKKEFVLNHLNILVGNNSDKKVKEQINNLISNINDDQIPIYQPENELNRILQQQQEQELNALKTAILALNISGGPITKQNGFGENAKSDNSISDVTTTLSSLITEIEVLRKTNEEYKKYKEELDALKTAIPALSGGPITKQNVLGEITKLIDFTPIEKLWQGKKPNDLKSIDSISDVTTILSSLIAEIEVLEKTKEELDALKDLLEKEKSDEYLKSINIDNISDVTKILSSLITKIKVLGKANEEFKKNLDYITKSFGEMKKENDILKKQLETQAALRLAEYNVPISEQEKIIEEMQGKLDMFQENPDIDNLKINGLEAKLKEKEISLKNNDDPKIKDDDIYALLEKIDQEKIENARKEGAKKLEKTILEEQLKLAKEKKKDLEKQKKNRDDVNTTEKKFNDIKEIQSLSNDKESKILLLENDQKQNSEKREIDNKNKSTADFIKNKEKQYKLIEDVKKAMENIFKYEISIINSIHQKTIEIIKKQTEDNLYRYRTQIKELISEKDKVSDELKKKFDQNMSKEVTNYIKNVISDINFNTNDCSDLLKTCNDIFNKITEMKKGFETTKESKTIKNLLTILTDKRNCNNMTTEEDIVINNILLTTINAYLNYTYKFYMTDNYNQGEIIERVNERIDKNPNWVKLGEKRANNGGETQLKLTSGENDNSNIQSIETQLKLTSGENDNSNIQSIENKLKFLMSKYYLFNSKLLLQIIGIFYDEEIFKDMFEDVVGKSQISGLNITVGNSNIRDFVEYFFINIKDEYSPIIKQIYPEYENINDIYDIQRDTSIFNKYDKDNKKNYLFSYRLLSKIIDTNIKQQFVSTIEISEYFTEIFNILVEKILTITKLYPGYNDKQQIVSKHYNRYYEKYKKVLTCLVENNKTFPLMNPRYKLEQIDQQPVLIGGKHVLLPDKRTKDQKLPYKQWVELEYDNFDGPWKNAKPEDHNQQIYKYGPYDLACLGQTSSIDVCNYISPIIFNKLIDSIPETIPENFIPLIILFLFLGNSGVGKTSFGVYNDFNNQLGILPNIFLRPEFTNKFKKFRLKFENIYFHHHIKVSTIDAVPNEMYKITPIGFPATSGGEITVLNFEYQNSNWKCVDNNVVESMKSYNPGKFILYAFDKREIEPTIYNENSSRSEVIGFIELLNEKNKVIGIITFADLAGNEPPFLCEMLSDTLAVDEKIKRSIKYGVKGNFYDYDKKPCDDLQKMDPDDERKKNCENPIVVDTKGTNSLKITKIPEDMKTVEDYINYIKSQIEGVQNKMDTGLKNLNKSIKELKFENQENIKNMPEKIRIDKFDYENVMKILYAIKHTENFSDFCLKYDMTLNKKNINGASEKDVMEAFSLNSKNTTGVSEPNDTLDDFIKTGNLKSKLEEFKKFILILKKLDAFKNYKITKIIETASQTRNGVVYKLEKKNIIDPKDTTELKDFLYFFYTFAKPPKQSEHEYRFILKQNDENFNAMKQLIEGAIQEIDLKILNIERKYKEDLEAMIASNNTLIDKYKEEIININSSDPKIISDLKFELQRLLIIQSNCKIRRFEGLGINKILKDLGDDINRIIASGFKLPPIYYGPEKNVYSNYENFKYDSGKSKELENNGIIMQRIQNEANTVTSSMSGEKLDNIYIVSIGVIGTSGPKKKGERSIANDPPNTPFIDNQTIKKYLENEEYGEMRKEIKTFIVILQKYDFYKNNSSVEYYYTYDYDNMPIDSLITLVEQLMFIIDSNNKSTLLGTMLALNESIESEYNKTSPLSDLSLTQNNNLQQSIVDKTSLVSANQNNNLPLREKVPGLQQSIVSANQNNLLISDGSKQFIINKIKKMAKKEKKEKKS